MQGFNMGKYVPPDLEGTTSGNKLNRKHALGARASKLASQGILTVRFEMPFAVWCATCPKPTIIGQGVRFNAEKRRVGAYHSTPVFAFRMRHADCGGAIEIHTDPKNTAYVVVEGGRKRDTGEDRVSDEVGQAPILTAKEREVLRTNAFAKLEKTIEDREMLIVAKARIGELEDANHRSWEDPYELNRRLRKEFRVGRHEREKDGKATEDLQDRMSLGMDLVPATAEDARRAALVDFGPAEKGVMGESALSKPLFDRATPESKTPISSGKKRLKPEVVAARMKESLVSEIVGNTRLSRDPFLAQEHGSKTPLRISGIKRKHVDAEATDTSLTRGEDHGMKKTSITPAALVNYDSDST